MNGQLEIKIEGKVPVDKFRSAIFSFLELVESVSTKITAGQRKAEWLVDVEHGSAIIRVRSDVGRKISEVIIDGVKSLQNGKREYPQFFDRDAIAAARDLGRIVDPQGEYISGLFLKNDSDPIEITSQTSATADDLLGSKHEEMGSVEGKIEIISDRNGFKCSVFDPLYSRSVICYFENSETEEKAYRAFRKRVLARGFVRFDREGKPVNIVVQHIREFPEENTLPTIEQVQEAYG